MNIAGVHAVTSGLKPLTTKLSSQPDTRLDLVNRNFKAACPNRLRVADITYGRTLSGFVYTAFVTDVFSRKIVGWSTRATMRTETLPLEALEQAINCAKDNLAGLIHHADHGSQYISIRYSQWLTDAGIRSSPGTIGDSYDNALVETINSLYKTELIYNQTWHSCTEVKWVTLNWVHWRNNIRIRENLEYLTPQEKLTTAIKPKSDNWPPYKKRNKIQYA